MGAIRMVGCDNPACDEVAAPESTGNRGAYTPPYGWMRTRVQSVGTGMDVKVETCSIECVEGAVKAAIQNEMDGM